MAELMSEFWVLDSEGALYDAHRKADGRKHQQGVIETLARLSLVDCHPFVFVYSKTGLEKGSSRILEYKEPNVTDPLYAVVRDTKLLEELRSIDAWSLIDVDDGPDTTWAIVERDPKRAEHARMKTMIGDMQRAHIYPASLPVATNILSVHKNSGSAIISPAGVIGAHFGGKILPARSVASPKQRLEQAARFFFDFDQHSALLFTEHGGEMEIAAAFLAVLFVDDHSTARWTGGPWARKAYRAATVFRLWETSRKAGLSRGRARRRS